MWWFSDVSGNNSVPIFRSCWWFGSTKSDDFSFGATKTSHPDAAVCPRNLRSIMSPRKLKAFYNYSVDKILSIKPKDASLALCGYMCGSGCLLSHHTFCLPQSRSLYCNGNMIAYQEVWAFYLRLAAGHIIALLHDMPDLPGDGAVGNNHYACWYHQDQQQHVDFVEAPEWRHIHNWNTVERRAFLSYCSVILVKKITICFLCHERSCSYWLLGSYAVFTKWTIRKSLCIFLSLSLSIYPTVRPSFYLPT